MTEGLFDRARAALSIEELADKLVPKLVGKGKERRAYCPICFAGELTGSTPFKIDTDKQKFHCFQCGRHGDVVDLYAYTHSMDTTEAAMFIAGPSFEREIKSNLQKPAPVVDDGEQARRIAERAITTWREAGDHDFQASIGRRYLIARGVDEAVVDLISDLRFHPHAKHHWDNEARLWVHAPALVAKVETTAGWDGGVHLTYLEPDGLAKSRLDPAKRMLGPQGSTTGLGVLPGGAWLISNGDQGDLVTGEGIETTLGLASWLYRQGLRDFRVAAALSLNRLQGFAQRDDDDCIDVWRPTPDPARPPFLWHPCNTADGERATGVYIAIDRDMGPVKVKGRTGRGKPVWFDFDAEARAKFCASLAAQSWKRAGWSFARPMFPLRGEDWGDRLLSIGGRK
jgi:hypothetical protein